MLVPYQWPLARTLLLKLTPQQLFDNMRNTDWPFTEVQNLEIV